VKCDKCANEATVHEVTIRSGKKVERHLCEQCAKGEGLPVQSAHASITQVLGQYIAQQAAGAASQAPTAGATEAPKVTQCPTCATTYAQFRHDGLLGCPDCYAAFEIQLGPLLERAHEGGTHHVGKMPRRVSAPALPGGPGPVPPLPRIHGPAPSAPAPMPAAGAREEPDKERAKRTELLRRKLAEAVAAEQYEAAAKLRDELRTLGEPTAAAPAKKASGKGAGGSAGGAVGGGGGGGGGAA
jgi:protein arginine kinase activator